MKIIILNFFLKTKKYLLFYSIKQFCLVHAHRFEIYNLQYRLEEKELPEFFGAKVMLVIHMLSLITL